MMETLQNMWVGTSLRLRSLKSDLAHDERGVTAVEYAVMLVLVAIAILIATPNISSAVLNVFGSLASRLVAGTSP